MSTSLANIEANLDEIIQLLDSMGVRLEGWPEKMDRIRLLVHELPDVLTNYDWTFQTTGHRGHRYQVTWQIFGAESSDFDSGRLADKGVDGIFKHTFFLSRNGTRILPDPYIDLQDRDFSNMK